MSIEMETKKFRKRNKKSSLGKRKKLTEPKLSDRSYTKDSPKTLIGISNEKQKQETDNQPSLLSLLRAAKRREEKNTEMQPNGDMHTEDNSLASNPNLPKATPPVFVTELSKPSDLKLPAIREEKTQEEIVLNKNSPETTHETDKTNETQHLVPNEEFAKAVIKDNSEMTKHETTTKLPPIVQAQYNNQNTVHEISESQKDIVPKLPALGGSQNSLNQSQDTQRTDATGGSSKSSHWQTAISFVSQRVQERLNEVSIFIFI